MSLVDVLARDGVDEHLSNRVAGAVVGVVVSVDDPDKLGRVKVKYPWLKDEQESYWAFVVTFMAGGDRGAVFRPEKDDVVVLVCDHGDLRFPYVVGSIWSGKDALPSERGTDADNNVRMIKSRSGHKIILDDTDGSEKVIVEDKNGNHLEMSSSGVFIKSQTIKIGSDGSSEALVLGTAFMNLFNSHTHPTGVGPSGPPTQQMSAGTHVSNNHKTE